MLDTLLAHCYALSIAGCIDTACRRRVMQPRSYGFHSTVAPSICSQRCWPAEALVQQINADYDALIIKRYGGSMIGFAGDSISFGFGNQGMGHAG
jgi:hypothetical protein